jgi:hypothetical protein
MSFFIHKNMKNISNSFIDLLLQYIFMQSVPGGMLYILNWFIYGYFLYETTHFFNFQIFQCDFVNTHQVQTLIYFLCQLFEIDVLSRFYYWIIFIHMIFLLIFLLFFYLRVCAFLSSNVMK